MAGKRIAHLALKSAGISLVVVLLFSFVNAQYASAVASHKLVAPLSRQIKHPVRKLLHARFYRGDMVNSYQPSQFSVTVLCPQELALLIRQVARGIHLCGLITGSFRTACGLLSLKKSRREGLESILKGATAFSCALLAPDFLRSLAMWSLGYAPY
ncbi:MAG TPA: hypothetical protein PKZ32_03720 [Candidatus Melainabacteria bacterium]|nr:hypothetical protein [Candidatus Melainabacteria bacterium]